MQQAIPASQTAIGQRMLNVLYSWVILTSGRRQGAVSAGSAVVEKVLRRLQPLEHEDSIHGHDPLMNGCHTLMNLLVALSKKDMLPAIIFNFNRAECECIGEDLVDLLEGLEGASLAVTAHASLCDTLRTLASSLRMLWDDACVCPLLQFSR